MNKKPTSTTRGRGLARFGGRKPFSTGNDAAEETVSTRGGRPSVRGFANAGAVFGAKQSGEVMHPQIIKMARKSGSLNLCSRSLDAIPDKVFHLHEMAPEDTKTMTLNMDGGDSDRWWESVDLAKLYLSSNTIAVIPKDIQLLGGLQVLDLSDNQLTTLPVELGQLKQLQRLSLSHNKLASLPAEAFELPDLRLLKLDHNSLVQLPKLDGLTGLDELDLSHNAMAALPESLCHLSRLTKLNVSCNKLKSIGSEAADLAGLLELDANHNQLANLSQHLAQLPKLARLYLHNNRLGGWPEGAWASLRELHLAHNCVKTLPVGQLESVTGLRILDLRDNLLDVLPDQITLLQSIERLDLANNTLSTIPPHVGMLPHLRSLPLDGNPLRLLRRDIIARGVPGLLQHLREKLVPGMIYPGFGEDAAKAFADDLPDGAVPEPSGPDKWQMKQSRKAAFNAKAAAVPDDFWAAALDAAVPSLDIGGNLLTQLPEALEALHPHTKELTASCNRLTLLPTFLGSFVHLQFLDLHANRLETLPECLSQLSQLRELNVTHNRLSSLPTALQGSSTLEILLLSDNRVAEVEVALVASWPRIHTLHLNNNDISVLPPKLGEVTQIRSLLAEGNRFRVPNASLLAKGTEELMTYLRGRIVPE